MQYYNPCKTAICHVQKSLENELLLKLIYMVTFSTKVIISAKYCIFTTEKLVWVKAEAMAKDAFRVPAISSADIKQR